MLHHLRVWHHTIQNTRPNHASIVCYWPSNARLDQPRRLVSARTKPSGSQPRGVAQNRQMHRHAA